jgi:hypothetical protein
MMTPKWDGRVYACAYCNAQIQVGIAAEQIAAGIAADFSDIGAFLAKLAQTLQQGFQDHVKVQWNGQHVHAMEVNLEPEVFIVQRDGHQFIVQHKKVVRGISLKTQTMEIDRWYQTLLDALSKHANKNSKAAWVLQQVTGGRR